MKCTSDKCGGRINLKDLKFINVFKYSAKCKKCGRNHFLPRKIKILHDGKNWIKNNSPFAKA